MNLLQIVHIECFENLTMRLCFSDHTEKIIDIGDFITKHPHPQYNKYLEWKNFKKAAIETTHKVYLLQTDDSAEDNNKGLFS